MKDLTTSEFKEEIYDYSTETSFKLKKNKPVIIDFSANLCGPCKMIAPVLDELSKEHDDIEIYKIDVDNEYEVAGQFKIRSIPTLLFVPLNGEPETLVGSISKTKIEDKIKSFLKL